MSRRPREEKVRARILAFRSCPGCTYDVATGHGTRDCAYGDCPYLPEELDPHCPVCRYNVLTEEGVPACNEPADCDFVLHEAPRRLELLADWFERQEASPR